VFAPDALSEARYIASLSTEISADDNAYSGKFGKYVGDYTYVA
jgi:hypothetical protein